MLQPVQKIKAVELFPLLSRKLVALLRTLSASEWAAPTACPAWSVKDVVAHLLGGSLGRLWTPAEITAPRAATLPFDEVLALINRDNAEWVAASRRISPHMLIELLRLADRRLYQHFKVLDEDRPARAAVAWAGESLSMGWFDIAREYSEKWLHQMHIREALGRPLLVSRRWSFPALDTFVRGLPYTFRELDYLDGTAVNLRISGRGGGAWSLLRTEGAWLLLVGEHPTPQARVRMDENLAWRLFSRGITPAQARGEVAFSGDARLALKVLELVSIMA